MKKSISRLCKNQINEMIMQRDRPLDSDRVDWRANILGYIVQSYTTEIQLHNIPSRRINPLIIAAQTGNALLFQMVHTLLPPQFPISDLVIFHCFISALSSGNMNLIKYIYYHIGAKTLIDIFLRAQDTRNRLKKEILAWQITPLPTLFVMSIADDNFNRELIAHFQANRNDQLPYLESYVTRYTLFRSHISRLFSLSVNYYILMVLSADGFLRCKDKELEQFFRLTKDLPLEIKMNIAHKLAGCGFWIINSNQTKQGMYWALCE